ncbi:hypothetical protein SDC9_147766 [bioreactor metagenome]|uniref:Uncharacterized protein n=1 Tax=bioreactor metagenome TaxID=1076179 RepID=A0A645EGX0_9ZZZZ
MHLLVEDGLNGIGSMQIQSIHQRLVDVYDDNPIPGSGENLGDEGASDVSSSPLHKELFHRSAPASRR